MQWSLIKTWAKEHGYTTFREKSSDDSHAYDYYWGKDDDASVTGIALSVSKLATQIYNHMSDNQFVKYQTEYQHKIDQMDINHNELSGQW